MLFRGVGEGAEGIDAPAEDDRVADGTGGGRTRREIDAEDSIGVRKVLDEDHSPGGELRAQRGDDGGPLLGGGGFGAVDGKGDGDAIADGTLGNVDATGIQKRQCDQREEREKKAKEGAHVERGLKSGGDAVRRCSNKVK